MSPNGLDMMATSLILLLMMASAWYLGLEAGKWHQKKSNRLEMERMPWPPPAPGTLPPPPTSPPPS